MFRYRQSTGELFDADGKRLGVGYAGKGEGLNAPEKQHVKNTGPLPRGKYRIGKESASKGPVTIELIPFPENEMFGRSGFLIHGWVRGEKTKNSSEGCPCLPLPARQAVAAAKGNTVEVVA